MLDHDYDHDERSKSLTTRITSTVAKIFHQCQSSSLSRPCCSRRWNVIMLVVFCTSALCIGSLKTTIQKKIVAAGGGGILRRNSNQRIQYELRSIDDTTLEEFYDRASRSALKGYADNDNDNNNEKLGDGCYHVFLDVGSNIGVHVRFLMESQYYRRSKGAVKIFEDVFGKRRHNHDFCIFSFEPNPNQRRRHIELRDAYKAMGWKYMPIQAGVSGSGGGNKNITFYHLGDTKHEEVGFTMMKPPPGSKDSKHSSSIDVPVVRLSSWIQRHLDGRKLPDIVYSQSQQQRENREHDENTTPPKVVMKLDIEGMEYATVPDLFYNENCLCNTVDYVMGEEHHWLERLFPMNVSDAVRLENGDEAYQYLDGILQEIKAKPNCKTTFNFLDDEAYMHDHRPLPTP
mmetsp:Transcript_41023/g.98223  ORF Transcript_41023/g.98223 Transcript_41023/m.98223 type:complete len:401 (+) Transcript_41023:142-1344(+)